ncbi:hypothetical protein fugu_007107 [Takifugu bimaculatus]|uniref:SS18 N-terminal domain-containing protein n=1 Tax=Takifugu bimaculatus TaxID=433685 RepID=A0A4Z2B3Z6_9TELE|nr:hypothetical protein fugu_007107 [Takifugu bimaculatus]
MLDENHHLIQCIMDYQSKGKLAECTQYQQILHRNLVYLATIADSNQNMQSLLPAPPTANMSMGPGGISQGGNLNDNGPLTSMMPSQMSNVSMMHQQSATPHYSSAQAGGQHYQGQSAMGMMGQGAPGNTMMSQRPMGSYRSSQQGSAQQYTGQDEFYGEQYGHTQSSSEPINQQYYPDGHGEYSYQPPPYGDQGYDRPFEESSQHYYEGGNSQYGPQQAQYQQGSGQQPFSQQQYSSQQGYGGQPQGYGEKAASLVRSRRHEHTLNLTSLLQLLARLPPPSTPSFSRVRANSTAPTALPREALEHSHRGPMLMSRVNMEIISNKILLLFSHCMKMEKGSLKIDTNGSAVGKNIDLHQLCYLLINHHPPETISDLIIVDVYPH